jgi:hypothetical protein
MAHDYLESGPDADIKSEISRLLDLVVFSSDRLEAMAGLEAQSPALGGALLGLKSSVQDCRTFFHGYELPPGVTHCLEVRSVTISGTLYRLFSPAPPLPMAGWMEEHYEQTIEALNDAVPVLKGYGRLPPADLVFSVVETSSSATASPHLEGACGIAIYKSMQSNTDGDFKQILAHELGHCFQTETFVEQNEVAYVFRRWREEGLAEYLSDLVYPHNNLEWNALHSALRWVEIATTLFDRAYTNSIFFQYLAQRLGNTGVLAVVETLPGGEIPGSGRVDQEIALGSYPNMDAIYHDFAQAMTDGTVVDASGAFIPYPIDDRNRPTLEIAEPGHHVKEINPFGVARYRIVVEAGKEADLTLTNDGDIRDSSRPANDLTWGELPSELMGDDCEPGVIFVATTTKPGGRLDLDFPAVRELPGETPGGQVTCGIEGTWVVDNGSLDISPMAFTLDYISGQIRITFRQDGVFELEYNNFEYRVSQEDDLNIGGLLVHRHEEFTYTTNAHGTTTYEVDGNEITFGHFSESSYLEGTETRRQVRIFDPSSSLYPDLDEVTTRDASGLGLFGGFVDFDVQSNGNTLQWRFGDQVKATLSRAGAP